MKINIFHKVSLQGLIKSKSRTFVTIVGVILSSALITAVFTFAVSLQNYMINGAVAKYGDWHISFPDVSSSFIEEQTDSKQTEKMIFYENIGYSLLDGGTNEYKPYLFLAGFNDETFDSLPVQLISGRLPQNNSEVLVPAHVMTNGGVKISIGDILTLAVGTRQTEDKKLNQHDTFLMEKETLTSVSQKTYTVVGICQRPVFEERSAPGYTLITKSENTSLSDSLTGFATLKNPYGLHSYKKVLPNDCDMVLNSEVLRFMGLSDDKIFNTLLYSVGGILVFLIMLGSVFMIYNSFHISLNERTHQFGILMSIGATEKQLKNSVLFEGLCIGAIGIPIGILTGLPSIQFVLSLVSENFANILYDNVELTLKISVPVIVATVLISMITILISAYIPAKKAAAVPIMECIRQTGEIKLEARAVKTSNFTKHIYGIEGMLALKNFKRNKRRYRSIVLSLTLSVVLFVSANAFGTYLKQTAEQSVMDSEYDIRFTAQDIGKNEAAPFYDTLKSADGIYKSFCQAVVSSSCVINTENFSDSYRQITGMEMDDKTAEMPVNMRFIEDNVYQELIKKLDITTGNNSSKGDINNKRDINNERDINITGNNNNEDLNMILTVQSKMNPSSIFTKESTQIMLLFGSGEEININCAISSDSLPDDILSVLSFGENLNTLTVIAPFTMLENFDMIYEPVNLELIFQSVSPRESAAQMQKIIEKTGVTSVYTLYNLYEIFDQNRNILFIVKLFTIVFIVMISLIAVANVFNTISTNIKLRRRELAMIRSVGMSDRDFNKMMSFECIFYGLRTLLFGLPISAIFSWLIYFGMAGGTIEETAGLHYIFPWGSIGISLCGVFFVIFITTLYTVRKIKKENIIDALRDDMA